jgi:hypothetical protein
LLAFMARVGFRMSHKGMMRRVSAIEAFTEGAF